MSKYGQSTVWRLAAILLTATIVAAACGDDGEGDEPASPETPAEQPAAEPAEPAAEDPEDVAAAEPATETEPAETSEQPADAADDPAAEAPADEDEAPAQPAEPVVVEMYAAEFLGDFINGVIDSFEADYPHIDVQLQTFDSYDAVFDSYVLAEEQGNEPAIANLFEVLTQQARDTGYFKPLHEAIGGRSDIGGVPVNLDEMLDGVANYYLQDGEYYSLPWNASTALTFANMDVLVDAGIASDVHDMAAIPRTYSDMTATCGIIRSSLDDVDCLWWPASSWYLEMSMVQQGALLVNNGNGREGRATEIDLTSDAVLTHSRFWVDSAAAGDFPAYADFGSGVGRFGSSNLAFFILSSGAFNLFEGAAADNGWSLGAAPLIAPDGPNHGQTLGGSTIYLTDGLAPEVEDAALQFLFYMVQPEQAAELVRAQGYVAITPAANQILEDEGFYDDRPWRRALIEAFALVEGTTPSNSGALFGSFRDYRGIYTNAITSVINDGGDLEAALADATAEINTLIEEYNLLVGG